ncbi:MAG TPA: hypothetical protein VLX11_03875, partial [Candidatus Acidoferrales bacterium]|nr:hypothetical protein [Candidatus Acidoferrales bacterium]
PTHTWSSLTLTSFSIFGTDHYMACRLAVKRKPLCCATPELHTVTRLNFTTSGSSKISRNA